MTVHVAPIAAILVHVDDVEAGLRWYARAFPRATRSSGNGGAAECLYLEGVQIELVPVDAKVGFGPFGSVVYWKVAHFQTALEHLLVVGAKLYRGPLEIENSESMCQVQDPWGNCIGIRGRR